jgi:hypothetical protein
MPDFAFRFDENPDKPQSECLVSGKIFDMLTYSHSATAELVVSDFKVK